MSRIRLLTLFLATFSACAKPKSPLDEPLASSFQAMINIVYCDSEARAHSTEIIRCREVGVWRAVDLLLREFDVQPSPSTQRDVCIYGRRALHVDPNPEYVGRIQTVCCGPPTPDKICHQAAH